MYLDRHYKFKEYNKNQIEVNNFIDKFFRVLRNHFK